MSWAQSLVRLSTFEVEERQKRLAEIRARLVAVGLMLQSLDAERAAEEAAAELYAGSGVYLIGYREGWRARRAKLEADLAALGLEEQGARDALNQAFEGQKKYEHVVEQAAALERAESARREAAALDELALRRRA